jgi:hypothetical protein
VLRFASHLPLAFIFRAFGATRFAPSALVVSRLQRYLFRAFSVSRFAPLALPVSRLGASHFAPLALVVSRLWRYSYRKARNGSIRMARRAGK